MKKSLIIIFIVILAIHILALMLLLKKDSGDTENPEPDSPPELIPEPTIDLKTKKTVIPHINRKKQKKTSTKTLSKTQSKPEIIKSTPLDFKGAVIGTIKEIPTSKNVNAGILVDSKTRKVLWSKNSKKAVPIASMTKMMTILLVFEDIKSGKISAVKPIKVSRKAASIGGSNVWLDPRETFPLNDLLKAVIIKSANDAAYLLAEDNGGGDVNKFVQRMNSKAKSMGLKTAFFANPNGLPEKNGKDNVCSCENLVFLAEALLKYPEVLKFSSTKIDYLPRKIGKTRKTMLNNTNKLVRTSVPGVDGLKTGFTNKAGSCITITCKRNGRRMILVLAGCNNGKERDALAKKLLDWGYGRK